MNNIKQTTPILAPLLGLVAGIYFQSIAKISIHLLTILLCFLCLVLVIFVIKTIHTSILKLTTMLTFFVLGAFCFNLQKGSYKSKLMMLNNKNLTILARVSDKKNLSKKNKYDSAEVLYFDIEKVVDPKNLNLNFSLICYSKFDTEIQVGDIVKLENVKIKKTVENGISGNNSYQDYLYKEGFLASIFLAQDQDFAIIEHPKFNIQRTIWNFRTQIYNELHDKIDDETFTYFALIFLGNTQQPEIMGMREIFNYWGLSHYLARSGLHIVFFILIWTFLFRLIPIGLNRKRLFIILLSIIYKLLSWSSIPFIRAFYVFLLMEGGKLFDMQTHFLHLLSVVCLLILIFNPLQLFFLDFQLSFGLTFTLSWMLRYFC